MKKKIRILCAVILLVLAAGFGIGQYFVNYALSPASDSADRKVTETVSASDSTKEMIAQNKAAEKIKGDAFEAQTKSAEITSDKLQLKAKYKRNPDSHLWVLLVHGYKSDNSALMSYGAAYDEKGYNTLLPDNRAHGESEGKYIGMGWLDKEDLKQWISWITEQDSQAEIVVHGVSMGGAATMMLSGENPDHVIAYVEDCGYTSVWDIFASELKKRFSLPPFPVLYFSTAVAKAEAGYSFGEASSMDEVKKCQKPMLFIHGGKDDFVPASMVYALFDQAECRKDLYIAEGAGHAESKDYDPSAYWNKVFTFIDINMNP